MLAQTPEVVADIAIIAGAIATVGTCFGVIARWKPIRVFIGWVTAGWRADREHDIARIVRGEVEPLTEKVTNLDAKLTAHMAEEAELVRRMDDRLATIEDQFSEHLQFHPGPGPRP